MIHMCIITRIIFEDGNKVTNTAEVRVKSFELDLVMVAVATAVRSRP